MTYKHKHKKRIQNDIDSNTYQLMIKMPYKIYQSVKHIMSFKIGLRFQIQS